MQSVVRVPWRAYMSTLPNEIVAAVFAAPTLDLGAVLVLDAAPVADEQSQYVDPATVRGRAGVSESEDEDENEEENGENPAPLRSISQIDSAAPPNGMMLLALVILTR